MMRMNWLEIFCFFVLIGWSTIPQKAGRWSASAVQAPTRTSTLVENDYNVLYDFYNATNGPYWRLSAKDPLRLQLWNFTGHLSDPCTDNWVGVSCICNLQKDCYVHVLLLSGRNLYGTLPNSIGRLHNVSRLYLDHNKLMGTVPQSVTELTQLLTLDVNNNFLNGSIPATIGDMHRVEILNFSTNVMEGSIPESVYDCRRLRAFDIHLNNMTGTLSPSVSNLQNLTILRVGINYLHGTIPPSIVQCSNLTQFSVQYNGFRQAFPMLLNQLSSLRILDISFNYFTGSIPLSFGSGLPHLRDLVIQNNLLTGFFDFDFASLPSLRQLSASNNFFHGTIPSQLSIMTEIIGVGLSGNFFTGTLPDSFHQWEHLTALEVHKNALHGAIAAYANPFFRLVLLDVSNCYFTGPMPNATFKFLETLQTFNNFLTGTIPSSLQDSKLMVRMSIGENMVSGSIPDWVGNFRILAYLSMDEMLLTGTIPSTLGDQNVMGQLFLSNNQLVGSIPSSIGNNTRLTELELGYNRLTGKIPITIVELPRLQILQLQSNRLSGTVVDAATTDVQSKLVNVDLSGNRFTGTLPYNLFYSNTLQSFVASDNCFHGSIPDSICQAPELNSLALDGITTATACQKRLFPNIPYFTAFSVSTSMTGNIPECIFAKEGLFSLHLSGNKLEGSLSANLTLSSTLIDLSLAHNKLYGSIPETIQTRRWNSLDLSFNRFDGTLMPSFATVPNSSAVFLQINRLSGQIPSALVAADNITMLTGNIFNCNLDETNLPEHDPDVDIYSCGSSAIDRSIFIWMGLIAAHVLFLVIVAIYLSDPNEEVTVKLVFQRLFCCASIDWILKTVDQLKAWTSALLEDDGMTEEEFVQQHLSRLSERKSESSSVGRIILPSASIFLFCKFLDSIRFIFFIVSALILVVLMPMYGTLSLYTGTYEFQYSWTISPIFSTGSAAGVCYFFGFLALIALTFALSDKNIFRMHHSVQKAYDQRKSAIRASIRQSMVQRNTMSLRQSAAAPILDNMSEYDDDEEDDDQEWFDDDEVDEFKRKWWQITGVLVLVASLNLIAMVLIDILYVVVILNSNGLVVIFTQLALSFLKLFWNELFLWKSIPFLYSWVYRLMNDNYEDAKGMFKHYSYRNREVSFMIFMVVLNNVIIPCISIAVVSSDCYYNAFFAEPPVSSTTVNGCNHVIDTANTVTCVGSVIYDEDISYNPPFSYRYQCSSAFATNYTSVYLYMFMIAGVVIPVGKIVLKLIYDRIEADHWLRPFIDKMLPGPLRDLTPAPTDDESHMFKRDKFIVRINAYLTVLLSFGAIFPPLAIVAFGATCSITFFEQLLLGRLLYIAKEKKYDWYRRKVAEDCNGTSKSWFRSLWIITPFACFGYSVVLFDTFGDSYGWKIAMIPAALMFFLPFLVWFFRGIYQTFKPIENKSTAKDKEVWLEMILINISDKLAKSGDRSARNSKNSATSEASTSSTPEKRDSRRIKSTRSNAGQCEAKVINEEDNNEEDAGSDNDDDDVNVMYHNPIRALSAKLKAERKETEGEC